MMMQMKLMQFLNLWMNSSLGALEGAWINQMLIENCLLAPLPLGDHADCLPATYKISLEKHLRVQ